MRKIGMRVLAAMIFVASIMLASCKYDNEPEDDKKNEQTGTKLTIVWNDFATEFGYEFSNEITKQIFISAMLYGVQALPETKDELPVFSKTLIDLDKYETEYKAKLGIGDKYFTESVSYELDTAIRYMNNSKKTTVYVCQFMYYSDAEYTNKISSVDIADTDTIVYARAKRGASDWSALNSPLAKGKE